MSEVPRRSERFVAREARELRRSCSSRHGPSSGSSRSTVRTIPSPSSSSRTAASHGWTGAGADEFDVIDRFLAAHGLDLDAASRRPR